ncbi:MAG TPA: hypothetical protein ENG66_04425 [Thermococcus sp.]|nr:hypothetical protein [Thermococcus sp.]
MVNNEEKLELILKKLKIEPDEKKSTTFCSLETVVSNVHKELSKIIRERYASIDLEKEGKKLEELTEKINGIIEKYMNEKCHLDAESIKELLLYKCTLIVEYNKSEKLLKYKQVCLPKLLALFMQLPPRLSLRKVLNNFPNVEVYECIIDKETKVRFEKRKVSGKRIYYSLNILSPLSTEKDDFPSYRKDEVSLLILDLMNALGSIKEGKRKIASMIYSGLSDIYRRYFMHAVASDDVVREIDKLKLAVEAMLYRRVDKVDIAKVYKVYLCIVKLLECSKEGDKNTLEEILRKLKCMIYLGGADED